MTARTYDGIEAASLISGLSKPDIAAMWERAKKNAATLEACARPHVFQAIPDSGALSRFRCAACGGEVEGSAARWYALGFEDGRAGR